MTSAPETVETVWGELVAESRLGVLLLDERGVVRAANGMAADLLGVARAELVGQELPAARLVPDGGGARLPSAADLAGQVLRMDSQLAVPVSVHRGELRDVRLWVTYQPAGRARLLVVMRPVQSAVGHLHGLLDPLTGLPNRALLLDRLDQALVRARTHGTLATLVLVDVNGMGEINAEFGFDHGDVLLGVLAGRLRVGLRDDYTVARYGGDRFAVVAEHPSGTGEAIAARVRDVVRRSVRLGGRRIGPNARVRWATSDGTTPTHTVIAHLESRLDRN